MNQRALSSSSMMLKGISKSSDWLDVSLTSDTELHRVASNPRLRRSTSSAASIASTSSKSSLPCKMSNGSSQSSVHRSNSSFQQLQRLNSSSLASMASGSLASRSSNADMGNATWDNDAKQPESLNMFDLQISEPKDAASSNPFLDGTYEKKVTAPRRSGRTHRSELLTLQEDLRCSFRREVEKDNELPLSRSSFQRSLEDIYDEFQMCTFREKMPKQIAIRDLSSEDLDSLKLQDPFMYYSIPAAKKAKWMGTDINLEDNDLSRPVRRRSAISFESADLLDGLDFENIPSHQEGNCHVGVDGDVMDLWMSLFD